MAFYGWPLSQCQETSSTLSAQLLAGIRVIDVRLAAVPLTANYFTWARREAPPATTAAVAPEQLKLVAYHGIYPQRTPFTTILSTLHTFLNSPAGASETVIMSLKQEDGAKTDKDVWSRLVREEIMASPGGFKNTDAQGHRDLGMWYLENRIPTLGEVRGKVVLFSRFNGDKANWEGGLSWMGIHPRKWPDSDRAGFVYDLKGVTVRTHDWCVVFPLSSPRDSASNLVLGMLYLRSLPYPRRWRSPPRFYTQLSPSLSLYLCHHLIGIPPSKLPS